MVAHIIQMYAVLARRKTQTICIIKML